MFTIDSFVDTVQTSKKQFVNTFVTNKAVADAMNQFIDQQSDYTKKAAKAGTDAVSIITNETVKAMQNATKFDYVKFGEGIMKAWTELQSKPVKSL